MFRNKTAKRTIKKPTACAGPVTDISGVVVVSSGGNGNTVERNSNVLSTENALSALLDAESKVAVHRPWLRLERGLRMRLMRAYVDKQTELSQPERVDMLFALVEALDRKMLNSKSQITYNQEAGEIVEINAMKIIRPAEGKITFRIEPPNRSTKKARRPSSDED
jgi:hypothetical protein